MDTETLSRTNTGKIFINVISNLMESRFRYKFSSPMSIINGVKDLNGSTVLEVGCGTGFFTISLSELIGDNGSLTAIDILQESVDFVSKRVKEYNLENANIMKRDVLNTDFPSDCFDIVILFGVVPAPMLPLAKVLSEIYRVLKPKGVLAIWPAIPGLQKYIVKSRLFLLAYKKNGVLNFLKD